MGKIILYHGTPDRVVVPKYGGGDEKHDYGKGFYLTESIELAKEWAVCRPNEINGWVHKYELETDGLIILDFQQKDVLSWLAELMKHRDAADSKRYRMLAAKFIEKYGVDTNEYDVIREQMHLIFILRRSLFGIILISIFLKNFFHWVVWESSIASNQKKRMRI